MPTGSTVVHGTTVSRLSHTTQISETLWVTTEGVVDYLDLNGDGFPDVVGHGAIQYTTSRGTLGGSVACGPRTILDALRSSTTSAQSAWIGGTVAELGGNARGRAG